MVVVLGARDERGGAGLEEREARGLVLGREGRDVIIMLCGRGLGVTVVVDFDGATERRLLADMLGRGAAVLVLTVVALRSVVEDAVGGAPLADLLIRLSRALLAFV